VADFTRVKFPRKTAPVPSRGCLLGVKRVTAIPDVAEGLRSLVEIVDNLNMAIQYIAAEREFTDAVIEPHQTRLLLRAVLRLLRDK